MSSENDSPSPTNTSEPQQPASSSTTASGSRGSSGTGNGGSNNTKDSKDNNNKMTPLSDDFAPGEYDVICGRGKKCYTHIGNEKFRERVLGMLDEYSKAKSKLDKSRVLSAVVDQVRQASPEGGFVKQDDNGKWHEVGDFLAREKTSQAFRDALHERYKSSNISKKKRRQEEQAKACDKFQRIARSEFEISARLEKISKEVLGNGRTEMDALDMFNQANLGVLRRLQNMTDNSSGFGRRFGGIDNSPRCSSGGSLFRPLNHNNFACADPLFGGLVPQQQQMSAAAQPSAFHHGGDGPKERHVPRTKTFPLVTASRLGEDHLHNSLPNMHFFEPGDGGGFVDGFNGGGSCGHINAAATEIDEFEHLHQSMPNLVCNSSGNKFNLSDLEPIPIAPSVEAKKTSAGMELRPTVKKPVPVRSVKAESVTNEQITATKMDNDKFSMDMMDVLGKMSNHTLSEFSGSAFDPLPADMKCYPPSEQQGKNLRRMLEDSGHQLQPKKRVTLTDNADKDLMECISKLTDHTISENGMYDPFPIQKEPTQRKSFSISVDEEGRSAFPISSLRGSFRGSGTGRFSPIDESESLEFGEG